MSLERLGLIAQVREEPPQVSAQIVLGAALLRRPSVSANTARVSVAVSTYCGEDLIVGCIEGLEAQTIAGELEIIVVDSGSPQNEHAIVEGLRRIYPYIVYLRTERETLYVRGNRALEVATGEYFANVNIDDWIRPGHVASVRGSS
jgi:glycosyltransferase involved in cell wall biosynthesis